MNAGAVCAEGSLLIFLHVDSRFTTDNALAAAYACHSANKTAQKPTTARFRLRFRRSTPESPRAYTYYEQKAELNRWDCIRGDQGFVIGKETFLQLGGFDTSLPFLEDVRIAKKIAASGMEWELIPSELSTSARRFETEGMYERQALNAVIACCADLGWNQFFEELPALYRSHATHGRLDLGGIFRRIRALIAAQPKQWRKSFWMCVGRYVASNAWQLFFWLDVRRRSKTGNKQLYWLAWYEHYVAGLFASNMAGCMAMVLTWFWLQNECRKN